MSKRRRGMPVPPTPSSLSPPSNRTTHHKHQTSTPTPKRRKLNHQTRSTPFEEALSSPEDDRITPPLVDITLNTPKSTKKRESMHHGKVKLSSQIKMDLLEEAMELAYKKLDFSRLSKEYGIPKDILKNEFRSLTDDPDYLIKTNIRKSALAIFNINPTFLIPRMDLLDIVSDPQLLISKKRKGLGDTQKARTERMEHERLPLRIVDVISDQNRHKGVRGMEVEEEYIQLSQGEDERDEDEEEHHLSQGETDKEGNKDEDEDQDEGEDQNQDGSEDQGRDESEDQDQDEDEDADDDGDGDISMNSDSD